MEGTAFLPTLFDPVPNLLAQARLAVCENNLYNINSPSVPLENMHPGYGGGMMYPMLVRSSKWELAEKSATRVLQNGFFLGTLNELLQTMRRYPEQVARFITVLALDRDSWWQSPSGDKFFPWVEVKATKKVLRGVGRWRARTPIHPEDGIIVFKTIAHRFGKPLRI